MGDGRWKPTGVTSEPQVTSRVIDGTAHAFMIFVTYVPALLVVGRPVRASADVLSSSHVAMVSLRPSLTRRSSISVELPPRPPSLLGRSSHSPRTPDRRIIARAWSFRSLAGGRLEARTRPSLGASGGGRRSRVRWAGTGEVEADRWLLPILCATSAGLHRCQSDGSLLLPPESLVGRMC